MRYQRLVAEALARFLDPALEPIGLGRKEDLARSDGRLQISAVVDSKARDPYRGGAVTLEFEISENGRFEEKLAGRVRLDQLLDARQRGAFLKVRNEIATRLERPPPDHLATIPSSLRDRYLRDFSPAHELGQEFWMRFRTIDDLEIWCSLVVQELPLTLERARSLSANEMYLTGALEW